MSGRGGSGLGSEAVVCPTCGAHHPAEERFCSKCRVPLVREPIEPPGSSDPTERQRRARKIKPQLAEGQLIHVLGARNQAEAEFIQGMLLEEGVPSLLRRTAGFDVPDFLAAGPRDVLVPASGVDVAREVLLQAELISPETGAATRTVAPGRLALGLIVALVLGALVVWALYALLG